MNHLPLIVLLWYSFTLSAALSSSLTPAVAEIDFEALEYAVGEGDGGVTVCVQLVEGHLSWPVTFRLSSADGTANGMIKQYLHCKPVLGIERLREWGWIDVLCSLAT